MLFCFADFVVFAAVAAFAVFAGSLVFLCCNSLALFLVFACVLFLVVV